MPKKIPKKRLTITIQTRPRGPANLQTLQEASFHQLAVQDSTVLCRMPISPNANHQFSNSTELSSGIKTSGEMTLIMMDRVEGTEESIEERMTENKGQAEEGKSPLVHVCWEIERDNFINERYFHS